MCPPSDIHVSHNAIEDLKRILGPALSVDENNWLKILAEKSSELNEGKHPVLLSKNTVHLPVTVTIVKRGKRHTVHSIALRGPDGAGTSITEKPKITTESGLGSIFFTRHAVDRIPRIMPWTADDPRSAIGFLVARIHRGIDFGIASGHDRLRKFTIELPRKLETGDTPPGDPIEVVAVLAPQEGGFVVKTLLTIEQAMANQEQTYSMARKIGKWKSGTVSNALSKTLKLALNDKLYSFIVGENKVSVTVRVRSSIRRALGLHGSCGIEDVEVDEIVNKLIETGKVISISNFFDFYKKAAMHAGIRPVPVSLLNESGKIIQCPSSKINNRVFPACSILIYYHHSMDAWNVACITQLNHYGIMEQAKSNASPLSA